MTETVLPIVQLCKNTIGGTVYENKSYHRNCQ